VIPGKNKYKEEILRSQLDNDLHFKLLKANKKRNTLMIDFLVANLKSIFLLR
jgi:hypothetical protein